KRRGPALEVAQFGVVEGLKNPFETRRPFGMVGARIVGQACRMRNQQSRHRGGTLLSRLISFPEALLQSAPQATSEVLLWAAPRLRPIATALGFHPCTAAVAGLNIRKMLFQSSTYCIFPAIPKSGKH